MWREIGPALRMMLFWTVVLGIGYPLAITGICQIVFPRQANGSLISANGKVVGSELIGQNFARAEYFHPRPSAAGSEGYDAANSGGSNYGPANPKLAARVKDSIERFRKENPDYAGPIPADLTTASASGLDPHVSPASAEAQAARVARARAVPVEQVRGMVARFTEAPELGLLGEARVNVLMLNLALDRELPKR